MTKSVLPVAAMEKILKKAGAARVSNDAKVALRDILEGLADEIGEKAVRLAKHSGRKTIKSADVKLAAK